MKDTINVRQQFVTLVSMMAMAFSFAGCSAKSVEEEDASRAIVRGALIEGEEYNVEYMEQAGGVLYAEEIELVDDWDEDDEDDEDVKKTRGILENLRESTFEMNGLTFTFDSETDVESEDDGDDDEYDERDGDDDWEDDDDDESGVSAKYQSPSLHEWDDAPLRPDADDPAIWVNHRDEETSFVIGTTKRNGLFVYDLKGKPVQKINPPRHPGLLVEDPPAPGIAAPLASTGACEESESQETFGRFNNVDVQYEFPLFRDEEWVYVDIAVVTDRGCDRLRIYEINPYKEGGPLFDITDDAVGRVFPTRYVSPSVFQPSDGSVVGWGDNPLDDQNTAYGLGLKKADDGLVFAFVSQRNRSRLGQFILYPTFSGTVSYAPVRDFLFPTAFTVPTEEGPMSPWSACREEPHEDPHLEGIVIDKTHDVLYAAQEVVGIFSIPLQPSLTRVVTVSEEALVEPVKTFGRAYWAIPEDDEYRCSYEMPIKQTDGTIFVNGSDEVAGEHIEPDAEGMTIYYGKEDTNYLIASSQGDGTFQVYEIAEKGIDFSLFHGVLSHRRRG